MPLPLRRAGPARDSHACGGSIARSFYQSDTLASEIQDAEHLRFLHHDRQLLATQSALATLLIGSDQQHSVLHTVSAGLPAAIAYTPMGIGKR